eukprot:CAMPEP_0202726012 /NCGR_PEP_ID=MMETSP1385-20130828/184396_1 /ASSEMBLY_ACC=CAM_ASM_000861 /TAXON_ID=933848 /ORGANISM="Elphidium margaritaceum" /LENGTH=689 /DNA_ID=CAMNT_0049392223 /DNA_START=42 /DNA_END=2111 /DNA_ORIENTATION=-
MSAKTQRVTRIATEDESEDSQCELQSTNAADLPLPDGRRSTVDSARQENHEEESGSEPREPDEAEKAPLATNDSIQINVTGDDSDVDVHAKQTSKINFWRAVVMVVLCLLCIAIIGLIVYWAQSTPSHTYQSKSADAKNIESGTITPTTSPTFVPSLSPSLFPSLFPSVSPFVLSPSLIPTSEPTKSPTVQPTQSPTIDPTNDPTKDPTLDPTNDPTRDPTTDPTYYPTQSPISIILETGNTILDQGISTAWPPNAFPDSVLEILITSLTNDTDAFMSELYEASTAVFYARSLEDITENYYIFTVENDPLPTANISYTFAFPIPYDLFVKCDAGYGYVILAYEEQTGYGTEKWPLFNLYPSLLDASGSMLTAVFYREMWRNKTANILLSCTPGTNINAAANNQVSGGEGGQRRRQLLQNSNAINAINAIDFSDKCLSASISCPIPLLLQTDHCNVLVPYSRNHIGVDYESTHPNGTIIAAANGVVEQSETSFFYGDMITLRHFDGSATVYKNLNSRLKFVGDAVTKEEAIGTAVGHLHFEYITNGQLYANKGHINGDACIKKDNVATGSIEVSDSGTQADDAFSMYIDSYYVCETELGELNKCTVSSLRCGSHTLSIKVIAAPDGYGTWLVRLFDGWLFSDGTAERNNFLDEHIAREPVGHIESWTFIVPCVNDTIAITPSSTSPVSTP